MTEYKIPLHTLAVYSHEEFRNRLMTAVDRNLIGSMDEYTVDSVIGRDIAELYQRIIQDTLGIGVDVDSKEISDGKYKLEVTLDNLIKINLYCKGWDTEEMVADNIMRNIIKPYIQNIHMQHV